MREMDDRFQESRGEMFPSLGRRHRSSGPPFTVMAVVAVLLAAGGLGWWQLRSREAADATGSEAQAAVPDPDATDPGDAPLVLPALAMSDGFVRELAQAVSSHPEWAAWLVSDELVGRFVATVVDVARGSSPAAHVEFMAPDGPFQVEEAGGRTVIAPASYRRYDLVAETVASLEAEGAARLYDRLRPLFEEAYAELGISQYTWDEMLAVALANLLAVEVPGGAVPVEPYEAVYAFADPTLQSLTPAEKHLLRMGPSNARRVQAKVREIGEAIGVAEP